MSLFLLHEAASGYGLFEVKEKDDVADVESIESAMGDMSKFSKQVKLKAFKPFPSPQDALEEINAVSECEATQFLQDFLTSNLPKVKSIKKSKFKLGVVEPKLGSSIQEECGVPCESNSITAELLRGVRCYFARYIDGLDEDNMGKAQLGLAHSYSRAKVKFNVNKVDNMVIQAICLLDTLDKDVNTFIMRVREWYSWHFPELLKIVSDNYLYARLVIAIKDKGTLGDDKLEEITAIIDDEDKAKEIIVAAKHSMGQDISPIDLINIDIFAKKVISLAEYRTKLHTYLNTKMNTIAPNLSALIGEMVGARLISHAGSLTNLAKYPASTVQILGAEKALFRALKTKGNTPKYGLIFHSSFIGRAKQRNKGRISRYLANKCSIASRIDCFMDGTSSAYGEKMKEQVEERLRFYEEGVAPRKNIDVMKEAGKANTGMDCDSDEEVPKTPKASKKDKKDAKSAKKSSKKRSRDEEEEVSVEETPKKSKKSKTPKKEKSAKKSKK